jgi:S1-C subfamily serine protease
MVRTTIQIRNGNNRGSGTVIASTPGETWILTAAHVVAKAGDLKVELHRFNFGSRLTGLTEGGGWPRLVPATVVVADAGADVALLRIRGMTALPFVARLEPTAEEPAKAEVLTSVGIDRGLHLTTWRTTVQGSALIDLGKGGGARPFTVTTRPPEHGRSGGGLFRSDGAVVGVCTGFFELKPGQDVGVFAAGASIRQMLRGQDVEKALKPPNHRP